MTASRFICATPTAPSLRSPLADLLRAKDPTRLALLTCADCGTADLREPGHRAIPGWMCVGNDPERWCCPACAEKREGK